MPAAAIKQRAGSITTRVFEFKEMGLRPSPPTSPREFKPALVACYGSGTL